MKKNVILAIAIALTAIAMPLKAQLVTYNFTGATGDQTSQAPSSVALNMTASDITRGTGITASAASNSISASNWSTGALDLNDYYSLTLTADSGFFLNLNTISFAERRSGTGIRDFSIRTSLDGFASDVFTASVPDDTFTRDQSFTFGPAFDSVSSITIRIYGYNAEGSTGTWRLNNHSVDGGLVVTGTVSAIPEPSTYALLGLGLAGLIALRRLQRAAKT